MDGVQDSLCPAAQGTTDRATGEFGHKLGRGQSPWCPIPSRYDSRGIVGDQKCATPSAVGFQIPRPFQPIVEVRRTGKVTQSRFDDFGPRGQFSVDIGLAIVTVMLKRREQMIGP